MKALPLLSVVLLLVPALGRDPRVGDVEPVPPAAKLERALNGTFAFPPSPGVDQTPTAAGFRADRLFRVPAPGIHPRILFGPEDVPVIRRHLEATEMGRGILAALRANVAKGLGTKDTWEQRCYSALVAGDLAAFNTAYRESPEDNLPPGSGFRSNYPGRNPATKWSTRNPLLASIEVKALLALLDQDDKSGREVAAALATYRQWVEEKVDARNAGPRPEYHWSSTRDYLTNEVIFAYDWAWPWLSPGQRDAWRALIVKATTGKYTLGMDLPPHWRNWNHLGMTESFATALFAIEGEPGDDPRARDRMFEVYRDYLSYGIDRLGTGTEGIGYQTAGIGHLNLPLLAYANRGRNLFVHPHWRRMTESWLVQAMQPFGGAWQSNGDLGNFPPSLWVLGLQKYFFPDSPGIDSVLRNHPLVRRQDWAAIAADAIETGWIIAVPPGPTDPRDAALREAAALVGGGLSFHDPERGIFWTRTGWGPEDLVLHVDARIDATFANHDHPDRGQFTLAALGRAWACDGYRDTESKYHNVVTIDGRGQGYFCPPGAWLQSDETPRLFTAVVDAKYCWDWFWTKSSFTESKASLEQRGIGHFAEAAERLQARFPPGQWEPDPTPSVRAYWEGFATRANGDPRMWDDEDGWVIRAPWYPVRKAFRSVLLVRGPHPYVLVADDIRKDDAEHLYEWRMNMPPDVEAVSINARDILLGDRTTRREVAEPAYAFQGKSDLDPRSGDRLLLVRTLDLAVPDLPTIQPIPLVAAIEYKKTDDSHQFTGRSLGLGKQVVIGSRSVEPRFLILLYPHRHGDPLPVTEWNADQTELTIRLADHVDRIAIRVDVAGRREFDLKP